MSDLDPREVLRVPCRLCIGPTQNGLDTTYPHGGTALGYFENGNWCVDEEVGHVFSEYLSGNVATVRGATHFRLELDLTQFDTTLLQKLYATATGALLEAPYVGGTQAPGLMAANTALLVAPIDTVLHPGILIPNPSYHHGRSKRVPQDLDRIRVESMTIQANVDGTLGVPFRCDYLSNLSLT